MNITIPQPDASAKVLAARKRAAELPEAERKSVFDIRQPRECSTIIPYDATGRFFRTMPSPSAGAHLVLAVAKSGAPWKTHILNSTGCVTDVLAATQAKHYTFHRLSAGSLEKVHEHVQACISSCLPLLFTSGDILSNTATLDGAARKKGTTTADHTNRLIVLDIDHLSPSLLLPNEYPQDTDFDCANPEALAELVRAGLARGVHPDVATSKMLVCASASHGLIDAKTKAQKGPRVRVFLLSDKERTLAEYKRVFRVSPEMSKAVKIDPALFTVGQPIYIKTQFLRLRQRGGAPVAVDDPFSNVRAFISPPLEGCSSNITIFQDNKRGEGDIHSR